MRNVQTLPRVGVLGLLLVALAGTAVFAASRAEALLPGAADINVEIEPGPFVFPADNGLGTIHVIVENFAGTKNARNVKVNLFEASMWPASVESVDVETNATPGGVICTHLSNINERCTIERLPVGAWVYFHVNLRTMDLGSADSARGVFKAAASTAMGELNTSNNKDKTDYFVVE